MYLCKKQTFYGVQQTFWHIHKGYDNHREVINLQGYLFKSLKAEGPYSASQ